MQFEKTGFSLRILLIIVNKPGEIRLDAYTFIRPPLAKKDESSHVSAAL